jgi:hypothetical protein
MGSQVPFNFIVDSVLLLPSPTDRVVLAGKLLSGTITHGETARVIAPFEGVVRVRGLENSSSNRGGPSDHCAILIDAPEVDPRLLVGCRVTSETEPKEKMSAMDFFTVEPEVAGWMGDHTILDSTPHPPRVEKLHYEFQGWMGDAIVAAFPCFIVTCEAKCALEAAGFTGVEFADAEISVNEDFYRLHPGTTLPNFVWLKPFGKAGVDDLGVEPNGTLVVSRRVLDALRICGLSYADITPRRS